MKRTQTSELIEALRALAKDLKGFGADERLISEAADRLEKKQRRIRNQRREIEALRKAKDRAEGVADFLDKPIAPVAPSRNEGVIISNLLRENDGLRKDKRRMDGFVNWLDAEIKNHRSWSLYDARKQLEKLRNGLGEQK